MKWTSKYKCRGSIFSPPHSNLKTFLHHHSSSRKYLFHLPTVCLRFALFICKLFEGKPLCTQAGPLSLWEQSVAASNHEAQLPSHAQPGPGIHQLIKGYPWDRPGMIWGCVYPWYNFWDVGTSRNTPGISFIPQLKKDIKPHNLSQTQRYSQQTW